MFNDARKSIRLANGEIDQDLPVQIDASQLQAVDEHRIGHAVQTHTGVDPLDPKRPEIALLIAPIPIRILLGLLDSLDGDPEDILPTAVITIGFVDDFLMTGVRGDAPFDACNISALLSRRA